jgi:hypothetical protein
MFEPRRDAVDARVDDAGERLRFARCERRFEQHRKRGVALGFAPIGDPLEPARDQRRDRRAPIRRAAANVVDRCDIVERRRGRRVPRLGVEHAAEQRRFGRGRSHDGGRDTTDGDARVAGDAVCVALDHEGDIDHRDRLRAPQPEFEKQAAPLRR